MIDYVECTAAESDRFLRAIRAIAAAGTGKLDVVRVPSCPEWTAADLTWHLAEVQYFWATIVEGNLATPAAVANLDRPADDQLATLSGRQSARLVAELGRHAPFEPCWSWHDDGHSVGWVRRRQAHEALIHRIDAELALETIRPGAGTEVDEELAADGIDEILAMILDASNAGDWGRFAADGTTARIEVPGRSWFMGLGRLTGTNPDGVELDVAALMLDEDQQAGEPSVTISGPASEIDLWLWRRRPLRDSTVVGDPDVADRLQQLSAVQ